MWGSLREDQLLNGTVVVSEAEAFAVCCSQLEKQPGVTSGKRTGRGSPRGLSSQRPQLCPAGRSGSFPPPLLLPVSPTNTFPATSGPGPAPARPLALRPPDVSPGPSKVSSRSSCSKGICCTCKWLKTTENYRHISDSSKSEVKVSAGPCSL